MSESRIKVRLTNAVDDHLQQCGRLSRSDVHTAEADAKPNSESVRTSIPLHLARQLGIEAHQHRMVRGEFLPRSEPILFEVGLRSTYDEALLCGDDVVIGHTVLAKLNLLTGCAGQRMTPRPDQPVSMLR